MGTVIERHGYDIREGHIFYDDRASSFEVADSLVGKRLDRRKNYAVIGGTVCESASWSKACSGCYEGPDSHHGKGCGCSECGYTGRRKEAQWLPLGENEDD